MDEQEKKHLLFCDFFFIPVDLRLEIKDNEKINKYLDFVRKLKICGTWKWNESDGVIGKKIGGNQKQNQALRNHRTLFFECLQIGK